MADIVKFNKIGTTAYSNTFERGDPFPLDKSSLYFSLEEAQSYASSGKTAYVGQLITVVDPNTYSDWVDSEGTVYTPIFDDRNLWKLGKSSTIAGETVTSLTFTDEDNNVINLTRTITKQGSVKTYKIDENAQLVQIDGEVIVDVNVDPNDGKVYATVPVKVADPSKWIQSNKTSGYFKSITYGNNIFVASDSSGEYGILYSTDGITWTQSNITEISCAALTYGNGKFVATVGEDGGIWYSTNGSEWTQSKVTSGLWNALTYGNGKFITNSGDGNGIWYSTDGITWTQSNITEGYYSTLVFVNGEFFASGGIDNHYTSSDGINWNQTGMINHYINDLIYVNGKYITASDDGILVGDSINYLDQSIVISGNFNSITYVDGKFVAASSRNGIYYSTDGIDWTQSDKTNGSFYLVTYANDKFLAGSNGSGIWYSDSVDGTAKKQLAYQEDLERAVLGDVAVVVDNVNKRIDALTTVVDTKAVKSDVESALADKADKTTTEAALADKLDKTTAESDYLKKTDAANAYTVNVTNAVGSGDVLKKYTITQGDKSFDINIPKDLVVTEGSLVIAGDGTEGTEVINDSTAGDKYLKLTIGNSDKPVYIPVQDLVDNYVGGSAEVAGEYSTTVFVEGTTIKVSIDSITSAKVTHGEGTVKTALEGLEANKRDKTDNVAHSDSIQFTKWKFHCEVPEIQAALEGIENPNIVEDSGYWLFYGIPAVNSYQSNENRGAIGDSGATVLVFDGLYESIETGDLVEVTATREKMTVTKEGESYVTKSYVDTKSTEALTEAKAYADSKSTADLAATKKYTDDMIAELDGSATIASVTDGVVTIKAGITETDGKVSQGAGADITLAKVATTGKAADISIDDAEGKITATTVEGALTELRDEIDSHHTVMTAGDTAGTIKYGDEGCGDNYHEVAVPYKDGENLGEAVTRIDEKTKTYLVEDGNTYTVISDKVADPSKWTQSNKADGSFHSVIYADGKFVAVGDNGIWYSTNGSEWIQSNKTDVTFYLITYGDGKFVADGDNGIWYSTNGSEWIQSNKTNGSFKSVTYADGKFVANGSDGIWYSTNGSEWIQSDNTDGYFSQVTYANGKFIAAGFDSEGIWYSTNGSEWTQSNISEGSFHSVIYGDGKFVATGYEQGIWYSTNGSEWIQSNKTNGSFYSITYADGKFVAVGDNGIWYSDSIESTDKKQLAYLDEVTTAIESTKSYVDAEIQKLDADLDSTKRDKDDNVVTADSEVFSGWVWSCDDPIVQDHLNNNNVKIEYTYYTDEEVESGASNHWYLTTNPELNGYKFDYNSSELPLDDSNSLSVEFYDYVTKLSDSSKLSITATRSKIKVAKAGESYVTQSYVDAKSTEAKDIAINKSKAYTDEKVTKIYLGTTTTNLINNDVSTIKINGSDAIAATGSMAMYNGELYIWTGSKWEAASKHSTEVANKVDKTTTIAGVDLQDNITKNEMLTALNVEDGAQVNKIEVIKIGGVALTITNKTVDIDNLILDGGSAS